MSKIVGVTVGTNISPQALKEKLKPVLSVNDVKPDADGNVTLAITNGKDGVNGKDGYTPIKGVDYFDGQDGKDGYTPVKGVDYFDGQNGQPGKDGADGISPVVAVENIDGGHRVTITDKNGAKQFDVMDGKDGEGGSAEGLGELAYKDKVGYGDLDDTFQSIVDDRVSYDEWAAGMTDLDSHKVDVDFEQNFTEEQKARARANIGAVNRWDELEGKPIVREKGTVNEPLNLQWDGNTEGLLDAGYGWYKVSDDVFSDEDIKKMRITWGAMDGNWMENPTFGDYWEAIVDMGAATEDFVAFHGEPCVAFVRKENICIEFFAPATFPETGVYFYLDSSMRTYSLTSDEPVAQTKMVERIDANYLPMDDIAKAVGGAGGVINVHWDDIEGKPFGEEAIMVNEPLNLTWDGNIEGLLSVDDAFFLVYPFVFSDEDIQKMTATILNGAGNEEQWSFLDMWDRLVEWGQVGEDWVTGPTQPFLVFVRKENTYIEWMGLTFPKAGIYFINQGSYVVSLTSTEPVPQPKTAVHIDSEYLPMDKITKAVIAALPVYDGEVVTE